VRQKTVLAALNLWGLNTDWDDIDETVFIRIAEELRDEWKFEDDVKGQQYLTSASVRRIFEQKQRGKKGKADDSPASCISQALAASIPAKSKAKKSKGSK